MSYSSINGEQIDQLSVLDRGLAYGDGFFTTAKVEQGKVCFMQAHLDRLTRAQQQFKFPALNISLITTEMQKAAKSIAQGVVKVLITAGAGGRGYSRGEKPAVTCVVTTAAIPAHYKYWQQHGISVEVSKVTLGLNPLTAGAKHLNRLEQVLVKQDLAERNDVDDLLVADIQQQVIAASAANVFFIKQEKVFTPSMANAGVDGIIRQQLLNSFNDIEVLDCPLTVLDQIDEAFITNALMGVVPVARLNGRQLTITKTKKYQALICETELDSISC